MRYSLFAATVALASAVGCSEPNDGATSTAAHAASVAAAPTAGVARFAPTRPQLDGRGFPDGVVALTWDDGPDRHTLELAEYLHRQRVDATFFVVESWRPGLSSEPGTGKGVLDTGWRRLGVLDAIVRLGHRVGNHTLNHVLLTNANARLVGEQLGDAQRGIDPFVGDELRLFRAPGGAWGADASAAVDADPLLRTLVGPIRWDVDRKDWEDSLHCNSDRPAIECEHVGGLFRVKPAVVAHRYLASIEEARRGIVLMHDRVGDVGSRYALDLAEVLVPALKARGFVFAAPVLAFSPLAPRVRAQGGGQRAFEGATLRLADVDGDGRADLCGRTSSGLACLVAAEEHAASGGVREAAFRAPAARGWRGAGLARALDRADADEGALFAFADVDGDGAADACARDAGGIVCSVGAGRAHELPAAALDEDAWDLATVRFGDVDGDRRADVCARTPAGVECARSAGAGFARARSWLAELGDSEGWNAPAYGDTMALADVNGDGRADLCARGEDGVACALSNGAAFGRLEPWSHGADFADGDPAAPWADAAYWRTIRFADLNGDGRADLCGRARDGVVCALSTGRSFTAATLWLRPEAGELDLGFELGDVNGDGRADLCATGADAASTVLCGLAP